MISIEFDNATNSETVYANGQDRLLSRYFNENGQPLFISPVTGPVENLNITYNAQGKFQIISFKIFLFFAIDD